MNELIPQALLRPGKDDKIRATDPAIKLEGEEMFFYTGGVYVTLTSPYGGIETCKIGFSWFTPFLKGDWLFGFLYFLATYFTRGLIHLIVPFIYNRYHIMRRLSQGWQPASAEEAELLRAKGFKLPEDRQDGVQGGGSRTGGGWRGGFGGGADGGQEGGSVVDDPYESAESWEEEKEQAIDVEFKDERP